MLHNVTGDVVDARCKCKASTMGRCSHVAALLYALLDFAVTVESSNVGTSKLCEWNRGRQIKCPLIADENQYKSKKKFAEKKAFDPRPLVVNSLEKTPAFIEKLKEESSSRSSVTMWELLLNPDVQSWRVQASEDRIQDVQYMHASEDKIQEDVSECRNIASMKTVTSVYDGYELLPSRKLEVHELAKTTT